MKFERGFQNEGFRSYMVFVKHTGKSMPNWKEIYKCWREDIELKKKESLSHSEKSDWQPVEIPTMSAVNFSGEFLFSDKEIFNEIMDGIKE